MKSSIRAVLVVIISWEKYDDNTSIIENIYVNQTTSESESDSKFSSSRKLKTKITYLDPKKYTDNRDNDNNEDDNGKTGDSTSFNYSRAHDESNFVNNSKCHITYVSKETENGQHSRVCVSNDASVDEFISIDRDKSDIETEKIENFDDFTISNCHSSIEDNRKKGERISGKCDSGDSSIKKQLHERVVKNDIVDCHLHLDSIKSVENDVNLSDDNSFSSDRKCNANYFSLDSNPDSTIDNHVSPNTNTGNGTLEGLNGSIHESHNTFSSHNIIQRIENDVNLSDNTNSCFSRKCNKNYAADNCVSLNKNCDNGTLATLDDTQNDFEDTLDGFKGILDTVNGTLEKHNDPVIDTINSFANLSLDARKIKHRPESDDSPFSPLEYRMHASSDHDNFSNINSDGKNNNSAYGKLPSPQVTKVFDLSNNNDTNNNDTNDYYCSPYDYNDFSYDDGNVSNNSVAYFTNNNNNDNSSCNNNNNGSIEDSIMNDSFWETTENDRNQSEKSFQSKKSKNVKASISKVASFCFENEKFDNSNSSMLVNGTSDESDDDTEVYSYHKIHSKKIGQGRRVIIDSDDDDDSKDESDLDGISNVENTHSNTNNNISGNKFAFPSDTDQDDSEAECFKTCDSENNFKTSSSKIETSNVIYNKSKNSDDGDDDDDDDDDDNDDDDDDDDDDDKHNIEIDNESKLKRHRNRGSNNGKVVRKKHTGWFGSSDSSNNSNDSENSDDDSSTNGNAITPDFDQNNNNNEKDTNASEFNFRYYNNNDDDDGSDVELISRKPVIEVTGVGEEDLESFSGNDNDNDLNESDEEFFSFSRKREGKRSIILDDHDCDSLTSDQELHGKGE
eukprot:Pgem_evm2s18753